MSAAFPYVKLPGGERGFVRRSSLWKGSDHLLLVKGTRFNEEYRRFYYRDIQAVITERRWRFGSIGWWVLNLLAIWVLALVFAYGSILRGIAGVTLAVLVIGALARAAVAIVYGRRCVLQTAVSREELPSLQRQWHAEKALTKLREKIAAAQGELPEEISPLPEDAGPPLIPEIEPTAEDGERRGRRARQAVNFALLAFVLTLAAAALSMPYMDGPTAERSSKILQAANAALVVCLGASTVLSMLKAQRIRTLATLRKAMVAALLLQGADVYASLVLPNLYTMNKQTVVIDIRALKVWQWAVRLDVALLLLAGTAGIIYLLLNWTTLRRGELSRA